jgi:hypothetical protein
VHLRQLRIVLREVLHSLTQERKFRIFVKPVVRCQSFLFAFVLFQLP